MHLIVAVILTALVCASFTQLVTYDEVMHPVRRWVTLRAFRKENVGFWDFVDRLIHCYRCIGVWLSVPSALLVLHRWPWTGPHGFTDFAVIVMAANFVQFAAMYQIHE